MTLNPSYECPKCGEWIEILVTTNENDIECPCGQHLRLDPDGEFENGSWRDLTKLVTLGSHWDE